MEQYFEVLVRNEGPERESGELLHILQSVIDHSSNKGHLFVNAVKAVGDEVQEWGDGVQEADAGV